MQEEKLADAEYTRHKQRGARQCSARAKRVDVEDVVDNIVAVLFIAPRGLPSMCYLTYAAGKAIEGCGTYQAAVLASGETSLFSDLDSVALESSGFCCQIHRTLVFVAA